MHDRMRATWLHIKAPCSYVADGFLSNHHLSTRSSNPPMKRGKLFKNTSGCKGLFRFTSLKKIYIISGQASMSCVCLYATCSLYVQSSIVAFIWLTISCAQFVQHCKTQFLMGLFLIQMVNLNTVSLSPKNILHFSLSERAGYRLDWGASFLFKMLFDHTLQEVLIRLPKNKCTFSVML